MAADPVIYCLERLSDYAQFERLCYDVLVAEGYSGLEPLGGSKDKGRDAVQIAGSQSPSTTVCAYSVREDWRKKLNEDCGKIKDHGHECHRVAFLCTASFSASERDTAIAHVKNTFGWDLDLYGLERLRITLTSELIARHPSIFTPPFFSHSGGLVFSLCRDHVIIDFVEEAEDKAFGAWLARRLTLAGYNTWCHSLAPTAGSSIQETIEKLIESRAFHYLCVFSKSSVIDPDLAARRHCALRYGQNMLIPLVLSELDKSLLDSKTRALDPIHFDTGWANGLSALLDVLQASGCPRSVGSGDPIALRSFMPSNVVLSEPEIIYSNRFAIKHVPEVIHRFIAETAPEKEVIARARFLWAVRKVSPKQFLAFSSPSEELMNEMGLKHAGAATWRDQERVDGILTQDLILELLRKEIEIELQSRGLKYCRDRKLLYFPHELLASDRLYFRGVAGKKSYVNVAGRRKFYSQAGSSYYRYHLAPAFSPFFTSAGDFKYTVRIRVRLTDDSGIPLNSQSTISSRRKHLCKGWWNKEWFDRILAVIAFLGDGEEIRLKKNASEPLVISAFPEHWTVPVRLNEEVDGIEPDFDEILTYAGEQEDPDEEDANG